MKLDPNKWMYPILSCQKVYVKNCSTKGLSGKCWRRLTRGGGGVSQMLTIADEGGRGGHPKADHCWRGGVYEPPILADVICEQPLILNSQNIMTCDPLASAVANETLLLFLICIVRKLLWKDNLYRKHDITWLLLRSKFCQEWRSLGVQDGQYPLSSLGRHEHSGSRSHDQTSCFRIGTEERPVFLK